MNNESGKDPAGDTFQGLAWVQARNEQRTAAGLTRSPRVRGSHDRIIDLASNDYLGLTRDSRVQHAAIAAVTTWGTGSTGSRLVTGTTQLHIDCETQLAAHIGARSARIFSSGYTANLAAITALCDRETLIVSDEQNHASLIDAIRLTKARVTVVNHRDTAAVEAALANRSEPRAVIVTDAIFSVDGDLAPLGHLHEIAARNDAFLIVDEAHSIGVIGNAGAGACAAAGIAASPHIVITATFSKALASQGGAVLADPAIIDLLTSSARTFIFDTGLAPASVAAAAAALDIARTEPELVASVNANAVTLHALATRLGWSATYPDGAVVSLLVGEPTAAVTAAAACFDHGVWVGCFRPPSVPDGVSRLRLTARANLDTADFAAIEAALTAAIHPNPAGQ